MKRFNIVLAKDSGGVEIHRMKEWLRQHPEHVPPGLDATSSTSHQLRNGLKKLGWSVQELTDEVRLIMPGGTGSGTKRPTDFLTRTPGPVSEVTPEEVTADELAKLRRSLVRILNALDESHQEREGVVARISRLSRAGRIPRETAALMKVVAEMRNVSEYEAKRPSRSESAAIRSSWAAVLEWASSAGIVRREG